MDTSDWRNRFTILLLTLLCGCTAFHDEPLNKQVPEFLRAEPYQLIEVEANPLGDPEKVTIVPVRIKASPYGRWPCGYFEIVNKSNRPARIASVYGMLDGLIYPSGLRCEEYGYGMWSNRGEDGDYTIYHTFYTHLRLPPHSKATLFVDMPYLEKVQPPYTARVWIGPFASKPFQVSSGILTDSERAESRREYLETVKREMKRNGFKEEVVNSDDPLLTIAKKLFRTDRPDEALPNSQTLKGDAWWYARLEPDNSIIMQYGLPPEKRDAVVANIGRGECHYEIMLRLYPANYSMNDEVVMRYQPLTQSINKSWADGKPIKWCFLDCSQKDRGLFLGISCGVYASEMDAFPDDHDVRNALVLVSDRFRDCVKKSSGRDRWLSELWSNITTTTRRRGSSR